MRRHAVVTKPDILLAGFVTLGQAQELAAELGAEAYAGELQTRINILGSVYHWMLRHKSARHPKRIRAELDRLSRNFDSALVALDQLSLHSEDKLIAALLNDQFPTVATCREHMARLRTAAGEARSALPSGAGRTPIDELRTLCDGLAFAYENFSGRRFSYDIHHESGGETTFLTDAADWVARVAKIVDPQITGANLRTAMRYLPNSLP